MQPFVGVDDDLGEIVRVLLGEPEREGVAVARDDRLDVRDRAGRGQRIKIEVGDPPHDRLSADGEPGEARAYVNSEKVLRQLLEQLDGLRKIAEDKATVGRDADEL